MKEKGKIMWAVDGEHWELLKEGSIGKLWDYFNFDIEIRKMLMYNPFAKFRLYGASGKLIGELPRTNNKE